MVPAVFISETGATRRGQQLIALKECTHFRLVPVSNRAADNSVDRGYKVALFNRAGCRTGFAMEAI